MSKIKIKNRGDKIIIEGVGTFQAEALKFLAEDNFLTVLNLWENKPVLYKVRAEQVVDEDDAPMGADLNQVVSKTTGLTEKPAAVTEQVEREVKEQVDEKLAALVVRQVSSIVEDLNIQNQTQAAITQAVNALFDNNTFAASVAGHLKALLPEPPKHFLLECSTIGQDDANYSTAGTPIRFKSYLSRGNSDITLRNQTDFVCNSAGLYRIDADIPLQLTKAGGSVALWALIHRGSDTIFIPAAGATGYLETKDNNKYQNMAMHRHVEMQKDDVVKLYSVRTGSKNYTVLVMSEVGCVTFEKKNF